MNLDTYMFLFIRTVLFSIILYLVLCKLQKKKKKVT